MARSNDYYHSSCPVVREGITDCMQRVLVGTNKIAFVPFLENILWLRESETQISYWHGGKVLKEGSTFSDYYGYFSSLKHAVEEATQNKESYEVDENSSLEIRVYCVIEETPVTYTPNDNDLGRNKAYNRILHEQFWFKNDSEKLADYLKVVNGNTDFTERHEAYDKIEHLLIQKKVVAKNLLVWSSKNSVKQNEVLLNSIINQFAIEEVKTSENKDYVIKLKN